MDRTFSGDPVGSGEEARRVTGISAGSASETGELRLDKLRI